MIILIENDWQRKVHDSLEVALAPVLLSNITVGMIAAR